MKYLDIRQLLEKDNNNKEWTRNDRKLASLFDDSKAPSKNILDKRSSLLGLCDRIYKVLPPVCWKTERTLAKELGESKRQIAYAKRILQLAGYIKIKLVDNKKYSNKAHCIYKQDSKRVTKVVPDVNWDVLSPYSPAELMKLPKLELLDMFDEANLYYIPLYYPIFLGNGKVICSCRKEDCRFTGKHPVIRYANRDFTDRSVRKRIRNRWQTEDENYNIGLLTKNFAVLDIDPRNQGIQSFALLQEDYGNIHFDAVVKTSDGGFHIYLPHRLKGQTDVLGYRGIDIKSQGGYVVAPTSVHKSGETYEWLSVEKPEPLSEDLLFALNQKSSKKVSEGNNKETTFDVSQIGSGKIEEGNRNDALFKQGIYLLNHGTRFEKLVETLKTVNYTRCKTPLPESEVLAIANSVSRYPVDGIRETEDMGLLP